MMKYPEGKTYGSIQPVCRANYLEELTRTRIKTLQVWITGIEEGDLCSGSVRMKEQKTLPADNRADRFSIRTIIASSEINS